VKNALLCVLAAGLMLLGTAVTSAQPAAGQMNTVLTVAFSGYDALKADLAYLGELSGKPEMANALEEMLAVMTGGKGLEGLDKSRPWGAIVQTDEEGKSVVPYAFIPVTDLSKLIAVLKAMKAPVEDAGNGVYEIKAQERSIFVQQKGSWAVATQNADDLARAPADPAALLGDLPQRYDLAIQATVKNIPGGLKQLALFNLDMGLQAGLERQPGETEEAYNLRTGVAKRLVKQLKQLINELDAVLIGLKIDQQAGAAYVDIEMTAIPGTDLADDFAQGQSTTTNFAGFDLPGAAVTANFCDTMSDADVEEAKVMLADARATALKEIEREQMPEDKRALAVRLINDLFDVLEKTVETRKGDGGMVLLLDPSAVTLAAGAAIAEGDKLEAALKALIAEAQKEEPEVANIVQLDAGEYQGLRLHKLNIPVPEEEAELRQIFGPTLEVLVAINNQTLYLVAGSNAEGVLKQIVDKSAEQPGKAALPARVSIAATPIAKFIGAMAQDDPQAAAMAAMVGQILAGKPGKAPVGGAPGMPGQPVPVPGGFEEDLQPEPSLF